MADHALGLFEGFGIELEYMIVDATSLDVRPLADWVLREVAGSYVSDVELGAVAWSNELVNHVLEIKTNGPARSLERLDLLFHEHVRRIDALLATHGARLLPTGAHPWMDPLTETQLWPHDYSEIYRLYNRIFDCRGHGWSNLQSMHINLPFRNDEEFARLHAAIRVILPLIPALCASTPVLDGRLTGFADSRLETYRHNQRAIPSIGGVVIPERAYSEAAYHALIFAPIDRDVRPYDDEGVLSHHFVNSRGAIARFDRHTIEIRIIDLQECPLADLSCAALIVETLRALVEERWTSSAEQRAWDEHTLAALLLHTIRTAEHTPIASPPYLRLFGMDAASANAGQVLRHLLDQVGPDLPDRYLHSLDMLLRRGSLASAIGRWLDGRTGPTHLREVYRRLALALEHNEPIDNTPPLS